jgi:hypothetical protein
MGFDISGSDLLGSATVLFANWFSDSYVFANWLSDSYVYIGIFSVVSGNRAETVILKHQ